MITKRILAIRLNYTFPPGNERNMGKANNKKEGITMKLGFYRHWKYGVCY